MKSLVLSAALGVGALFGMSPARADASWLSEALHPRYAYADPYYYGNSYSYYGPAYDYYVPGTAYYGPAYPSYYYGSPYRYSYGGGPYVQFSIGGSRYHDGYWRSGHYRSYSHHYYR